MRAGEPFLLNPDNRALMEGRVSYKHLAKDEREQSTRSLTLIILFSIIVGIFLIALTVTEWQHWATFRDSGVQTQGIIADSRIDSSDNGTSYHVRYTYQHTPTNGDPRTFTHEQQVNRSFYEQAELGRAIVVIYTPENPTVSTLDVGLSPPWQITLFSMVGIPLFLWIPLVMRNRLVRQNDIARRLRQGSRKLMGEILYCTRDIDDGDCHIKLTYRFQSPESGQILEGNHERERDDLRDASKLPASGTPVIVLYRDDKTFQVL
jgi:hypothetical protein